MGEADDHTLFLPSPEAALKTPVTNARLLRTLLIEQHNVFSHHINMKDDRPIRQNV